MNDRINQIADVILEVERQLRLLDLWSSEFPSEEQLSSEQPFAVDTLSFNEWLQFLFLPKIKVILEQSGGLPRQSHIAPMAEEFFKTTPNAEPLIRAIKEFDELIND